MCISLPLKNRADHLHYGSGVQMVPDLQWFDFRFFNFTMLQKQYASHTYTANLFFTFTTVFNKLHEIVSTRL